MSSFFSRKHTQMKHEYGFLCTSEEEERQALMFLYCVLLSSCMLQESWNILHRFNSSGTSNDDQRIWEWITVIQNHRLSNRKRIWTANCRQTSAIALFIINTSGIRRISRNRRKIRQDHDEIRHNLPQQREARKSTGTLDACLLSCWKIHPM